VDASLISRRALINRRAENPTTASAPTPAPIPIPGLAPVLKFDDDEEEVDPEGTAEEEVESEVRSAAAVLVASDDVPEVEDVMVEVAKLDEG
jgi:hypothetical protein